MLILLPIKPECCLVACVDEETLTGYGTTGSIRGMVFNVCDVYDGFPRPASRAGCCVTRYLVGVQTVSSMK